MPASWARRFMISWVAYKAWISQTCFAVLPTFRLSSYQVSFVKRYAQTLLDCDHCPMLKTTFGSHLIGGRVFTKNSKGNPLCFKNVYCLLLKILVDNSLLPQRFLFLSSLIHVSRTIYVCKYTYVHLMCLDTCVCVHLQLSWLKINTRGT